MGLSPPTPPAFNTPGAAFSLLSIASEFFYFGDPYSGHDSGSYDSGYPSRDYDSCPDDPDIPQATMTPAPTTPDMHQATVTSAPTTPVSYPFQMEESRPPHQWNYPIHEGKGEGMRLQMSKGIGKGRLPAYSSIASIRGVICLCLAGGVCCSAHYPSYATTSRCREPSAFTITRCYVGSIRFRGVGTWFLSGLRAEGCACSLNGGYSTKWIAYASFRPFGSGRIVHGKGTPTCNPCSRCRLEGAFGHRTVWCSPDARNMVFGILESGLSQGAY